MNREQREVWDFLNKELAKLKVSIQVYHKTFDNININNDAYNLVFQLFLDGLTKQLSIGLSVFFDRTRTAWSLYRLPGANRSKIEQLRSLAQEIIDLRDERLAHLSRNISHKDNFVLLTATGLQIVKNSVAEVHSMLSQIAKSNSINESWALDWVGVESSAEILIEHLRDGGYLLDRMSGAERHDLRQKIDSEENRH